MRHLARVHPASAHGRARAAELTHFCTHCATLHEAAVRTRVCTECGLGVVLTCSHATLDRPGAAFLVVTSDLRVSAASEAADAMFAAPDGSYGRPLMSLLTSPEGMAEMARIVMRAASGTLAPSTIPVEAASSNLEARELEARVGGCGNPPAALVVVEVTAA